MYRGDMTQYQAAARKRTQAASLLILIAIPLTILAGSFLMKSDMYMVSSLMIVIYTIIPFFIVFEKRRPKAREIVLVAMMTALTVVIHLFFHVTVPVQAGTAMIIVSGIALGPEAGFLIGALARFVCNFYMGQGPWTPWQMFCWGILGFLAGLAFNKVNYQELKARNFREELSPRTFQLVMGPVLSILAAFILAYVSFLIWPGRDESIFGWRLYAFGAAGLLAGVLIQRRKLNTDGVTMALFTFFTVFIIYGGIMNICAMVTAAVIPGADPVSWETLRILYISGVPYDLSHALSAALFVFLFGDVFIRKIERIKIKYGIYR